MSVDFKITIANEFQSIDEFLKKIRGKQNSKVYPQIDRGIKEWTREKLENSNPNVTTLRYLTVSCRANSLDEQNDYKNEQTYKQSKLPVTDCGKQT